MRTLPLNATEASRTRYELAKYLVEQCPLEFGREIALTGSASLGVADQDSDIEMNFWVEAALSTEDREKWLRSIGATHVISDAAQIETGSLWTTFLFRDIWVEAGWQTISSHEELLHSILAGDVLDHERLIMAWIVENAVPLRSTGLLDRWQQMFSHYPDALLQRLIANATETWVFPHLVAMPWACARRGQRLKLTARLLGDAHRALRIVFALNRRWEPDWKWLPMLTSELTVKPDRLNERIEKIFSAQLAEQSATECMELILDTLTLVPACYDVRQASSVIKESLRAHKK